MASINSVQDGEITYLTGINSSGMLVNQSYWTWNRDAPATYSSSTNYTAKFGSTTAGTGATVSYYFDPASNFNATEKATFAATAALWSAVANISFVEGGSNSLVKIDRNSDTSATGGQTFYARGRTGSTTLGQAMKAEISIDTTVDGFGPLGGAFSEYGGYPYQTLIHEWGHVLGLGHGGAYNESDTASETAYSAYDNRAWTLMSYIRPATAEHSWGTSRSSNGYSYRNEPTTPMMLDILAIQRLYGVAVNTPLSGGQTYGFNSNIGGEIGKFYDFTQNAKPIVTLWNKGTGNTLDLSGFTQGSKVDLHDGSFSSVAGLTNNLAIAYDTRIDKLVLGSGNDSVTGNDNGNAILGGAGADTITGGSGNDHLYGQSPNGGTDGNDSINGGAGNDYIHGNAGDDTLDGGDGSDRIQGGQGHDSILGGAGNDSINGNLGNDTIDGGDGNDSLRGGQGNDSIMGGDGNDILQGDLGSDTLVGGAGIDILTGGGDADLFVFTTGSATFATTGPTAYMTDTITDFTDGVDRIRLDIGSPTIVLQGQAFDSFASAAAAAQDMLDSQGYSNVVALKVGNDSYLFYDPGPSSPLEAIRLQGFSNPALIDVTDFA
jgi:serralysin